MQTIHKDILTDKKKIHFIGIGGSGMYPLVQILHGQGFEISGSDMNTGTNIEAEIAMGITVYMGHSSDNLKDAELVVYTAAISEDNPELLAAMERGIPTIERSIMLGLVSSWFKNSICISGTHGKTSTTSMTTHILIKTGGDPSAVIGGKLPIIGGNGRYGASDNMVCEACEFNDTFLKLQPNIAVILNIDEDHMDYFKTMDNLIASFNKFASLAREYVVINGDDPNCHKAVQGIKAKVVTCGLNPNNDYYVKDIEIKGLGSSFTLCSKEGELCSINLSVPGIHNITNSLMALVSAILSGTAIDKLAEGIVDFGGAGRRFELLGKVNGITIVDDFAHHPTEIDVTMETAKNLGYKNVWAVFQPYTYSRTALLLEDFVTALSKADRLVMTEIVSAREENIYNIHTKDIADKIPNSCYFNSFQEICDYVMNNAKEGDLVVTMGGGDIYKCAQMMINKSK